MAMVKKTPADRIYAQGVPLDAEQLIRHADVDIPSPVAQRIDWEQAVDVDNAVRQATRAAASHYHYVNTSNMLLCDNLLSRNDMSEPSRTTAQLLLRRNAVELNAWSKYVEQCGAIGPMGAAQQEYFRTVWDQDTVLPVLLGVQHINIAEDHSYQQFQHGDPLFQEISNELRAYNDDNAPAIHDSFRTIIAGNDADDRRAVLQRIAQQIDLLQIIVQEHDDETVFKILGTTADRLAHGTAEQVKVFYDEIGLTDGLSPDML